MISAHYSGYLDKQDADIKAFRRDEKLIIPDNIPRRKRRILGPLGRFLMKVCNWKIVGEFPTHKRMVLIAVPHTAMRDAWYALLAVLALDLKINF